MPIDLYNENAGILDGDADTEVRAGSTLDILDQATNQKTLVSDLHI